MALQTLTTLNRQQLATVFQAPQTLLAFEAIQRQVASVIPDQFNALANLDFVVTMVDTTVSPNAKLITAGANINVAATPGVVTIKVVPAGTSGQTQYNNAGVLGGYTMSGDATLNTTTGVLTLATVTTAGTYTKGTYDLKGRLITGASAVLASADFANQGTIHTLLHGNAAGNPSWGAVDLTADVTGVLPAANGGTGAGGTQSANLVYAGPASGAAAAPTFRALVSADLPVGSSSQLGAVKVDGTTITASGGVISATGGGASTLIAPQGRLTLVTGVPVMSSDQTSKTDVYYTNYVGSNLPIYNGSAWTVASLASDLHMALDTTNHLLYNVYDLFAYAGPNIGAGPAWKYASTVTITIATPAVVSWTGHGLTEGSPVVFSTSGALPAGITAGTVYFVGRSPGVNSFNIATSNVNGAAGTFVATSGSQSGTQTATNATTSRGTGAGTTELQMLNGIWVNKNAITLTNGAGAGTAVAAHQATYLGSFFCTANGQTGMAFSPAPTTGGAGTIMGLYNAYNRLRTLGRSRESTASWTYSTATWRAANNSIGNRVTFLDGLGQSAVESYRTIGVLPGANAAANAEIGISFGSTNGAPVIGAIQYNNASLTQITASDRLSPQLGIGYAQAVEIAGSGISATFQASSTTQLEATQVALDM